MESRIALPTYLIAKDEAGKEFLLRTSFPKFVASIDRSINIASTQLTVFEWWDEDLSSSRVLDDAILWLKNKFLQENTSKKPL